MADFKVLLRLEATDKHPEAFVDPEFFYVEDGHLCAYVTGVRGRVVDFVDRHKRTVACLQARLWSDYARRYLGEQIRKNHDREETLRLHAEAVKARDTECMWLVWGWDQNDFPHLQGREKYAKTPATPESCC